MRFAAFVIAGLSLAACGARGSQGPAWPEPAARETDGGESIAPREADAVAAVDDDAVAEAPVVAPAAAAATSAATTTTTTTPTVTAPIITAPEDTITVEEIVIEISDE